jgi:hypothetical protein
MRTPACTLLAVLACTLTAGAQGTVAEKRTGDTEKLWKIEVTGISG